MDLITDTLGTIPLQWMNATRKSALIGFLHRSIGARHEYRVLQSEYELGVSSEGLQQHNSKGSVTSVQMTSAIPHRPHQRSHGQRDSTSQLPSGSD